MTVAFRPAKAEDLPTLIRLLADDALGKSREVVSDPPDACYLDAFDKIAADHNNELVVACRDGQVIGMMQLTFIPYLSRRGSERAMVEGVRVDSRYRGQGIGRQMLQWAIGRARERDCQLVQLTSDKQRSRARQFYESLGFRPTHEGFKMALRETR